MTHRPMHSLLNRQLRRSFGESESAPKEISVLLDAVDDAYHQFDIDRRMLERSLDLSSQELLQTNSDMRAIFEALPDFYFLLDAEGTILDRRAGVGFETPFLREMVPGKRIQSIAVDGVGKRFDAAIRRVQKTSSMTTFEYSIQDTRHRLFHEVRLLSVSDNQIIVVVRDITDRKLVEIVQTCRNRILEDLVAGRSLKEVLTVLSESVEQIHPNLVCSVLVCDEEKKHLRLGAAPNLPDFYNDAVDGIPIGPGVGSCGTAAYTGERVVVTDIATHPYWEKFRDLAKRAGLSSCWSEPIKSSYGEILGTLAIYSRQSTRSGVLDVLDEQFIKTSTLLASLAIEQTRTKEVRASNIRLKQEVEVRVQSEDRIKASLKDKEILLKEIHHRVKNNLQIMSSLLSLQAHTVADPAIQAILAESQTRMRAMALIHEQLYRSNDLGRVDFAEYTRKLTDSLVRSYGLSAAQVSLRTDVANILLDVDVAVPCGLIINELVSNAIKHAFPDGRQGEIAVSFQTQSRHSVLLQITDDGVGVADDFSLEQSESLGFQLVESLARQMSGSIETDTTHGFAVKITIPMECSDANAHGAFVNAKQKALSL